MLTYAEAPMAYGLTRGMAQAIGVDLVRAVTEGWIGRDDLDALVDACVGCGHGADCLAWLSSPRQGPALPDWCANKSALESLRG